MKISPVFGLVLIIHVGVITLLVLQPGCQSTRSATETTPEDTLTYRDDRGDRGTADAGDGAVTVIGPHRTGREKAPPPSRAISEPTTIDDAFNAGFETSQPVAQSRPRSMSTASGARASPTRPEPGRPVQTDSGPAAGGPEPVPVTSGAPRFETYRVEPGDSLWQIAKDYDISLDELLKANNMTKQSVIRVGQSIRVPVVAPELAPAPPSEQLLEGGSVDVSSTAYTVQPGDTLTRIANRFGTTVAEIKSANNRRRDTILVGETLIVPVGEVLPAEAARRAKPPARSTETTPPNGQYTHVVQAGENPTMIAGKYGMRTADLIRLNGNFDPRRLYVGQVLIVDPAPGKEPDRSAKPKPTTRPPSVEKQQTDPQPIRIRVMPPEDTEADPASLLEDVEEIPVVPVVPVDGNP